MSNLTSRQEAAMADTRVSPLRQRMIEALTLTDSCTAANHVIVVDSSFPLDLNGSAVVLGCARNDHQVATRRVVLATHQLADRSDGINDRGARRVGHEAL
jgi:hypothetical protein